MKNNNNEKPKERLWNHKQAACYLGISESMLYKLTSASALTYYKINRIGGNRYSQKHLDEFLAAGRIDSINSITKNNK